MGNVWLLVNVKEVANIIKNVSMADALITITMAKTTTFIIKNVMTEMIKTTITAKMAANKINNVKRNNNARTAFA